MNENFRSYRDLKVWRDSFALSLQVYRTTAVLPPDETYGLRSQMRRSSISVPSNIAEGHASDSSLSFLRHLSIALGSLAELETQLLLASELNFINSQTSTDLLARADEIGKMLRGLQKSIRKRVAPKVKGRRRLVPSL